MISTDQGGFIKYWQQNFNNVKEIKGHEEPIRDVAFAPTDMYFVTASDDASLKIWDFAAGSVTSTIKGHGWDVRTCDWHPSKGLIVSGSKDHQIRLWDPRNAQCLQTLHTHKAPIAKVRFEPSRGLGLATCARDNAARIYDIRMMRDILHLQGHERDITTITWHPIHRNLVSTGCIDGSIHHYILDEQNHPSGKPDSVNAYCTTGNKLTHPVQNIWPRHRLPYAHDSNVWSLDWHPMGHLFCSGSNDKVTRFWVRPRPGDTSYLNDRYHIGEAEAERRNALNRDTRQNRDVSTQDADEEGEGLEDQGMPTQQPSATPALPGLPGLRVTTMNGVPVRQPSTPMLPISESGGSPEDYHATLSRQQHQHPDFEIQGLPEPQRGTPADFYRLMGSRIKQPPAPQNGPPVMSAFGQNGPPTNQAPPYNAYPQGGAPAPYGFGAPPNIQGYQAQGQPTFPPSNSNFPSANPQMTTYPGAYQPQPQPGQSGFGNWAPPDSGSGGRHRAPLPSQEELMREDLRRRQR